MTGIGRATLVSRAIAAGLTVCFCGADAPAGAVDRPNVVIVMTSNLKGEPIEYFKPEFVNRIDEIIRFVPLTEADLAHIVEIQVAKLRERLAVRRITLDVTPEAFRALAAEGYDPAFGARPLKRVIQKVIGDNASLLILEGKIAEDGVIKVDVQDGRIVLLT